MSGQVSHTSDLEPFSDLLLVIIGLVKVLLLGH